MAKKRLRKKLITPIPGSGDPWYKKIWIGASVMGVVLFTLIINAPSLLANLENFPRDMSKTKNKFLSWYYEDEYWTGFWSSFPEGYVNMVEMELSDVDLKLDIVSENGQISGIIAAKKICEAAPFSHFLLVDGEVDGGAAAIKVYDFVGGKRREFVTATLKRDGGVMTVVPTNGFVDWLPNGARIGVDPDPKEDEKDKIFAHFCREEREAAVQLLRKNNPMNDSKTRRPMRDYLP